jgi:hypothetical protein
MYKSGRYTKIYRNKGLKNEFPNIEGPNSRPDLMGVRKDGTIDIYERPSKYRLNHDKAKMRDMQRPIQAAGGFVNDKGII